MTLNSVPRCMKRTKNKKEFTRVFPKLLFQTLNSVDDTLNGHYLSRPDFGVGTSTARNRYSNADVRLDKKKREMEKYMLWERLRLRP